METMMTETMLFEEVTMGRYLSQESQELRNKQICALYAQGLSLRKVAKKFGLSVSLIRLIVLQLGNMRQPGVRY